MGTTLKARGTRVVCPLIAALIALAPYRIASAEMIETHQALQREKVAMFVSRADVAEQLRSHGVDPLAAKARVQALTNFEVDEIAGKIDELPAGGAIDLTGITALALKVFIIFTVVGFLLFLALRDTNKSDGQ